MSIVPNPGQVCRSDCAPLVLCGTVPSMSETALAAGIREALTAAGYWVWRCNSGHVRTRGGVFRGAPPGTPDILVVLDGRLVGIEVKTREKDSKQSPSQIEWQALAEKNGVRYSVAHSAAEALSFLRSL